jgi:beta-mannosidase
MHVDLVANGIIADPFRRMGELGCRWVDECDWSYRTTFSWSPAPAFPRRVRRFEGLDTVREVLLNGEKIADHDSMFVPLEVDVSDRLQPGANELRVDFRSAVRAGQARRAAYFAAERLPERIDRFDERAFVRKAQYMSGWDWGSRLVTCGIWQPVSLIEYAARIRAFRVFQERLPDGRFRIRTETDVEGDAGLTLAFADRQLRSRSGANRELDFILDEPALWWPNVLGKSHLYPASARLDSGSEGLKSIGLRKIELRRERDRFGESLEFIVNDRRLWARGANWIPNDSFPSRITTTEYREQMETCRALGMNMLRVWGGGLYESGAFYDACDAAGILVWQDFSYACS